MYISVDTYEELYLKGKDRETLECEVEKLRNEISRIKRKMEMPYYIRSNTAFPTDEQVIEICRGYFEKATLYLKDALDNADILTEEERAAAYVDSMTKNISCVTLTVGRYLQEKYELDLTDKCAKLTRVRLGGDSLTEEKEKEPIYDALYSLRLGEWRQSYLPEDYGCTLSEPVRWQLRIDYFGKAAPRFYDGLGIFPYNFNALCKLLGADVI